MKRRKYRASKVAFLGLLFALSVVLSLVESSLAPMVPVPGVKLGLSNIVTMYCLFCLGWREAYSLAALKSLFVLLTRGPVGAAMSFAGGLVSVTAMLLLRALPKKPSELFTSICGGLMHNAGQLVMAVLLLNGAVLYYFPVLALGGVAMGALTGLLLRLLRPHFNRIFF